MEYIPILTIAESEKSTIELARMAGYSNPVVIKRLRESAPDIYQRLAGVSNPHLPRIFDVEESEGELLVAEEYVDGVTLEEYLEQRRVSDENKLQIALQLCEAVGFLHALKPPVIHRDIKPSNILITGKGVLKLIDFDASRQYKEMRDGSDTRLLGTIEYAPPEQFGFSQTDVRSDIFSMGVVFHEMELKENKKWVEVWEKIVKKCTNFDPKHRYQSVQELKKDIEKLLQRKKTRAWKPAIWGGIWTVLGVAIVLVMYLWPKQEQEAGTKAKSVTDTPIPTAMTISPEPTLTATPEPTLTATPEPTLTPTPEPTLTATPEPTLTPTGVPSPTVATITSAPEIPENVKYHYYKALSEKTELILRYGGFVPLDDAVPGRVSCYNYLTNETIEVPLNMVELGTDYVWISREFVQTLEPSTYNFTTKYYYNNMSNYRNFSQSVVIHSEEEEADQAEWPFVKGGIGVYLGYPKNASCLILCNSTCQITGIERSGTGSDTEPIDEKWYDILHNGKALEIKKEYLMQYCNEEKITLICRLNDGRQRNITVTYYEGLPEGVDLEKLGLAPTSQLIPTVLPSPTPTVMPAMPETINQHYYKGYREDTELVFRNGSEKFNGSSVRWTGECYNYVTGETIEIPEDMIEVGEWYTRFEDEFLLTLEPAVYKFTVEVCSENDIRQRAITRTVEIHSEEETLPNHNRPIAKSLEKFDAKNPLDASFSVFSDSTSRFTGIRFRRAGGTEETIDSKWYDISCDGKIAVLRKEFLMQYSDEGTAVLIFYFDDGKQADVTVTYE